MDGQKLSPRTKIAFGIGDIGGNVVFTIMAFWVQPFLIDTLGLMPAFAGIAVWIAKIWDAVTDPLMGFVSDRTRTRWGRRRPYLFIGAFLALVAMGVMFLNPHFNRLTQQSELFVWAIFAYCLLCTAYTIFNIPYSAITPDLTTDYHEQTSLNGTRMTFAVVGTILGASAFQPLYLLFTPAGSPDNSPGYLAAGIIFGAVVMAVTLITFFFVREKPVEAQARTHVREIFRSYFHVLRNKPYRIVLLTYAISIIGTSIIGAIIVLYFKYIYQAEDLAFIALSAMLGVTLLTVKLVWEPVIRKVGKHRAYAIGLFIMAVVTLIVFFLAPMFNYVFMFVMMAIAGLGLSSTYIAPFAMIPDTIEYDQVRSGRREEGIYYGLWTFFSKSGQAMAGLIYGLVLQVMQYAPHNNIEVEAMKAAGRPLQTPEAFLGIRLLLGPIATIFLIAAGFLVLTYPITEKVYLEMMDKKKGG